MDKLKKLFTGVLLCCLCMVTGSAGAAGTTNIMNTTDADADASTVTIMGAPELTREQLVQYIEARNPNPKLSCSVEDLVNYYYYEAAVEGVRPDVAVCQAIK